MSPCSAASWASCSNWAILLPRSTEGWDERAGDGEAGCLSGGEELLSAALGAAADGDQVDIRAGKNVGSMKLDEADQENGPLGGEATIRVDLLTIRELRGRAAM